MVVPLIRKCSRHFYLILAFILVTCTVLMTMPSLRHRMAVQTQWTESVDTRLEESRDLEGLNLAATIPEVSEDDDDVTQDVDKVGSATDKDGDDNGDEDDDDDYARNDEGSDDEDDGKSGEELEITDEEDTRRKEKELTDLDSYFTIPKQRKAQKLIILTYMRSGSTLTGDLFQNHPDVFYMFEPLWKLQKYHNNKSQPLQFFNGSTMSRVFSDEEFWNIDSLSTPTLRNILDCRFLDLDMGTLTGGHLRTSTCTKAYSICLAYHPLRQSREGIRDCLHKLKFCSTAKVKVVKTIRYTMEQLERFLASDPDLKVIHLFRDPRGSLLSQYRVGEFKWKDRELKAASFCDRMLTDLKKSLSLSKKFPGRILTVRYEDIVQFPIESAEYMYNFVGLNITNKLKMYIWSITFAGRHGACRNLCTVRANSTDTAYKWRQRLDFETANTIDLHCSIVYDILGYRKFPSKSQYEDLNIIANFHSFGNYMKYLNPMEFSTLKNMSQRRHVQKDTNVRHFESVN